MKVRTLFQLILLCLLTNSTACRSSGPGNTPATVEEAEAQIAKKQKADAKAAKKSRKLAQKEHLKRQSKAVRKSLKRNAKMNKRLARQRR